MTSYPYNLFQLFGECYKLLVKLHGSQYIKNIDRLLDKSVRGLERESRGNTISKHPKSVSVDPKIVCRKEATDSVRDTDCMTPEVRTMPDVNKQKLPSVKEQCKYFDSQSAEENFRDVVKRGDKCDTLKRQEYVHVGRKKAVDTISKHRSSQFIRKRCAIFEGGETHSLCKKQNWYTNSGHSASHITNNISNTTVTDRRRGVSKCETVNRSVANNGSGNEKHIGCFKNKLNISVDNNKKPSPIISSSISSSSSNSSSSRNNKPSKSIPPVITDLCHSSLSKSSRNSTNSGIESFHESGEVEKHESGEVEKHENGEVEKHENGEVEKHESGEAEKHESGEVEKHENGEVEKHESGEVEKHENGEVEKHENGEVEKHESGEAEKHESGEFEKHENGEVEKHESGEVEKHESSNEFQSSIIQNQTIPCSVQQNSCCQEVLEECDAVTQLDSRLTTPTSTVSVPLKVEYKTLKTYRLGDNQDADGLQTESTSCIYEVRIELKCSPPNEEEKPSEHGSSLSNQHCNNDSPSGDGLSSVSKEILYTEVFSIDTGNIEQSPETEQQIFVSSCEPQCTSTAHLPSQEESDETNKLHNDYKPMNASFRRNCYQFKPITPSSELLNKNASGANDCGNEYEELQPRYTNDIRSGKSNSSIHSAYDFPLYQLYDFERVS